MEKSFIDNEKKKVKKLLEHFDAEYINIVKEILNSNEFKKMQTFLHHEDSSVYLHCLLVSYKAYKISKFFLLDYESTAIAGLLHDFYNEDWHISTHKNKNFFDKHGFRHPKEALINANKYFSKYMNDVVRDSIVKHMFPLTIKPPCYLEGWIVTLADKIVSLSIFKNPYKLLTYVGIGLKKGDEK